MKTKKLMFIFIIFIIIGTILLVPRYNNKEKVDLYNVKMDDDFEFEKNTEYFIDSSHVEIIGEHFYFKTTGSKAKSTVYYYNAKVTNKYNQEYYIIVYLNSAARTNMLKGNLKDISGSVCQVNSKIKDRQMNSLGSIAKNAKVYNMYLGVSVNTGIQLIGVSFIFTGVICMIIVVVQSKKHKIKEEKQ